MTRPTPMRIVISVALIAIGCEIFYRLVYSGPIGAWIGLPLLFTSGTTIGAGISNLFNRPIMGALAGIVGVCVQLLVLFNTK